MQTAVPSQAINHGPNHCSLPTAHSSTENGGQFCFAFAWTFAYSQSLRDADV